MADLIEDKADSAGRRGSPQPCLDDNDGLLQHVSAPPQTPSTEAGVALSPFDRSTAVQTPAVDVQRAATVLGCCGQGRGAEPQDAFARPRFSYAEMQVPSRPVGRPAEAAFKRRTTLPASFTRQPGRVASTDHAASLADSLQHRRMDELSMAIEEPLQARLAARQFVAQVVLRSVLGNAADLNPTQGEAGHPDRCSADQVDLSLQPSATAEVPIARIVAPSVAVNVVPERLGDEARPKSAQPCGEAPSADLLDLSSRSNEAADAVLGGALPLATSAWQVDTAVPPWMLQVLPYLEATVSGDYLGQLAAGPVGREFLDWQPVSLTVDSATAELLGALSGQCGSSFLGGGFANQDGASDVLSDLAESEESSVSSHRASMRRHAASRRVAPTDEPDLFLMKAKAAGSNPRRMSGQEEPIVQGGSSASSNLSPQAVRKGRSRTKSARAEDGCSVSGLQVKSVRLLNSLPDGPDILASNLQALQPQPPSQERCSSGSQRLRPKAAESVRPEWDSSFVNCLERIIPPYDALLDSHCPIMTNPSRLQHVVDTQELSGEYLHIVRARFEQHRRLFDFHGELGAQNRPEPPPTTVPPRSIVQPPDTLTERMKELDKPSKVMLSKVPALWTRPALICSPEWRDSALHHECLHDLQGGAREVPLSEVAHPTLPPKTAALTERWRSMGDSIQILWQELQTPLPVRQEYRNGPLHAATPHTVYQLEVHLRELLDYRAETKQLIFDVIDRESVSETLNYPTALCLGDERLVSVQAAVTRLDVMSVQVLRAVGAWARRFQHLIVDTTRHAAKTTGSAPPAVFVWGARDYAEIIQTGTQAVANGSPPSAAQRKERASTAPAGGRARQMTPGMEAKRDVAGTAPLVKSVLTKQRQSVLDVLHPGPPPPWYSRKVADAGVKRIRTQREVRLKYVHTGGVGRRHTMRR
mmetsp:Transcript_21785/g.40061  ORF Transcript_21785/g.40061 Transcript_21785/m.40061 type:complete len:929 (-) Transcript_21785:48-2834(-)